MMKAHWFSVEPKGHGAGSPQGQTQAWPKRRTKRQKENHQLEMWKSTQSRKRNTVQGPRNNGNTATRKTRAVMSRPQRGLHSTNWYPETAQQRSASVLGKH